PAPVSTSNGSSTTAASDYGDAFPSSRKVYLDGAAGVRVPMREIGLSGGEPPLRVYDTSGPRGGDVRIGLPALRAAGVGARGVPEVVGHTSSRPAPLIPETLHRPLLRARGAAGVTQMHYARRGDITPEMEFIALREGVSPELVRSEVARGRAIIP